MSFWTFCCKEGICKNFWWIRSSKHHSCTIIAPTWYTNGFQYGRTTSWRCSRDPMAQNEKGIFRTLHIWNCFGLVLTAPWESKTDQYALVSALKIKIVSRNRACWAQSGAQVLGKNENESVRYFGIKIQQLAKRIWCNGSTTGFTLKSRESFNWNSLENWTICSSKTNQ